MVVPIVGELVFDNGKCFGSVGYGVDNDKKVGCAVAIIGRGTVESMGRGTGADKENGVAPAVG